MTRIRLLALGIAVLFAVAAAQADSLGDGRVGVSPAPPGDPPPSCGSLQFSASSGGSISAGCVVTGSEITSITIAVPETESSQPGQPEGLQVVSPLTTDVTGAIPTQILDLPGVDQFLSQFNWSESCGTGTVGSVAVFECTLTAPQQPTGGALATLDALLTEAGIINNGECDAAGFIFGIPVGCDINFSTTGDNAEQLFAGGATMDASTNGAPLAPVPEPGTISLFALGILMMLPGGLRRKGQRQ